MTRLRETMNRMTLQDLPPEILTQCFKHLSVHPDLWIEVGPSRRDLEACRLTSKCFAEIVAPILIHHVRVDISQDSLARLEEISQHSVIAKSIRTIEINLSFYDALLAKDFAFFARCNNSSLARESEVFERFTWGPPHNRSKEEEDEVRNDYAKACLAEEEWYAVAKGDYDKENPTAHQLILREAHQEYGRLFEDQELAKRDDGHISKLGIALQRLTGLREIMISDEPWKRSKTKYEAEQSGRFYEKFYFSDKRLKLRCLQPYHWKGTFFIAETSPPPAHLIPDIFTTLQQSSIFPRVFTLKISPPNDLAVLELSPSQLQQITHVLSKATTVSFSVSSWSRQDSNAVDNKRPYAEIQHLGNLTRAFFDVPHLESLHLSYGDYPAFYEVPQISASQILPLQTRTYPRLRRLALRHIPFHEREVRMLVDRHRGTVRQLEVEGPYLLSGSWVETVELFRGLETLERVKFENLHGGEFENDPSYKAVGYPGRDVPRYLMRKREDNPVAKYFDKS